MTETILYISYNGITEPLVRSQVLNYLEGLVNKGYSFVLLTFEKVRLDDDEVKRIHQKLQEKGIEWHWLPYHHKPKFLGTARDIHAGTRLALKLTSQYRVKLLHARSFVPALIARNIKRKTGIPFVNDIRGFWVDEKAYKGSLRQDSLMFQWGKRLERKVYLESDAIVSLSKAGLEEINSWILWQDKNQPLTVTIPTCVDIDAYRPRQELNATAPVFGYVGSLGRGYLGRELFQFFKAAQNMFPESRLLIVSRSDHAQLEQWCSETAVNSDFVEIIAAESEEVPVHVARMDVGLSFIEPHYAKKASCPTKLGEYLASGIPVVANTGIGDTDTLLSEAQAGVVIESFTEKGFSAALEQLVLLLNDTELPDRCRSIAERVFSLDHGIDVYSLLYRDILN